MTKRGLFEKAYRLLDKITPIKTDCGELCDKACCDSADEEAGMYLFPGEEVMYRKLPSWLKIEKSDFIYRNKAVSIAICMEQCERNLRPLACRIFPLTPYYEKNGAMVIRIDPRAVGICPLARKQAIQKLDEDFIEAVINVFKFLARDKDIRAYIRSLSRLIDEDEKYFKNFFTERSSTHAKITEEDDC